MAEATILYDAGGNPVPVSSQGSAGVFILDAPPPAAPVRLAPTPAAAPAAPEDPQASAATTQSVQSAAEAGDVQGGNAHVPFGPAVHLSGDEDGRPADPGYRYDWFDGVPRRTFRIAPSIGLMPLLRFAHAAKAGMDTDDMEGMAALYDMIADCVHPDDWASFQAYATDIKAEDEELMEFVSAAMEIISARKAQRRGSSSATSPRTSPRSKGSSSQQGLVIPDGAIRPAEIDGLMPVRDLAR